MNSLNQQSVRRLLIPLVILLFGTISFVPVFGQQKPPKPVSVTVSREYDLNFGSFCSGNGLNTKVIIDPYGQRTKSGNIFLLNSFYSAARYDVSAQPGTFLSILFQDATLTGPNSATMTLQVGGSDPPSPFVATAEHTTVTIGGTLIVGATAVTPAGRYDGDFYITFIQE